MKTENYQTYFGYVNSFITGKGLDMNKLQETNISEFVIFCQKFLSKEISDTITYQLIDMQNEKR